MRRLGVFLLLLSLGSAAAALAQSPSPGPAPVKVLKIWRSGFATQNTTDDLLVCGVTFKNVSSKPITAIKWLIVMRDAVGEFLGVQQVFSVGVFAPSVAIEPDHVGPTLRASMETTNDANAWDVPNPYGADVTDYDVVPAVVRFSDGTTWTNPANAVPLPAPSPADSI